MKEPDFESIKQINVIGHEYWSVRDLQKALGYEASWQNFEKVIGAAMVAATSPDVGLQLAEHFNEVVKMSRTGQGGQRKTRDYFLSRSSSTSRVWRWKYSLTAARYFVYVRSPFKGRN